MWRKPSASYPWRRIERFTISIKFKCQPIVLISPLMSVHPRSGHGRPRWRTRGWRSRRSGEVTTRSSRALWGQPATKKKYLEPHHGDAGHGDPGDPGHVAPVPSDHPLTLPLARPLPGDDRAPGGQNHGVWRRLWICRDWNIQVKTFKK